MEIKIFEQFENIKAGFTLRPADGAKLREVVAELLEAEEYGEASFDERDPDSFGIASEQAESGFEEISLYKAAKSGKINSIIHPCLVHGTNVAMITQEDVREFGPYIEAGETDALLTNVPGVVLTTTHGDCIPVFFVCPSKGVVGLAHAGWKGTADCIVSVLLELMTDEYGCEPEDIYVYIGPGIGFCCFEVEDDVKDYFIEGMDWTEEYTAKVPQKGKYHIDLKGINDELCRIECIPEKNIEISAECTCCDENKYYSYRRDKDKCRMLAYIYKDMIK